MGRMLRRRIALAVALAALLAGGTAVALGATGADHGNAHHARMHRGVIAHHHGGVLYVAASYLGLSPRQLREQLRSGKSLAQLAASMPGKSETGLIAALLAGTKARRAAGDANLEARVKALVNTPGFASAGHSRAPGARRAAVRAAVLSYLGIRGHQLLEQFRAGKTLAQIADSTPGKSAAGLTEVLVKTLTAKLNAAVAADRLSKKGQAVRLAVLHTRISHALNRSHPGVRNAHPGALPAPGPAPSP
ncbi:MAG TPA: hypothetical protein VIB59_00210 [Solirubrobacteraceae bacterium]